MTCVDAAKELKRNIQVMTSTFESNNLRVLNIACKPYGDDDPDLQVFVELESVNGTKIPCDLNIKINLYDRDGELYMTDSCYLDAESFGGYDTVKISCCDDSHTLDIARKGRLYVTKE